MIRAYTSTVVSRPLIAVSLVLAGAVGLLCGWLGPLWIAVLAALVVLVAGLQLAVVHLSIGPGGVRAGYGWWSPRRRVIAHDAIDAARALELDWAAVFGLGQPFARAVRLTVRPGRTLQLRLRSGEDVRISTADADVALAALDPRSRSVSPEGHR